MLQGLEVMINTIEECWDQDAEARVSANCVHERLIALGRTANVSTVILSTYTLYLQISKCK